MVCCSTTGCNEFFTDRVARRDAARYRRRGLDGHARDVVGAVTRRGVMGRRVLEVGGGVGTIQIELLRAGAGASEIVDISPAYDSEAERLLDEAGLPGMVARRHLDFATQPHLVDAADIVVMNRVLCCYPDYATLTQAAADHAKAFLVVTYPRDAWWTRAGIRVLNLIEVLRRRTFRVHLHAPDRIAEAAASRGLTSTEVMRGPVWELRVFERFARAGAVSP